MTSSSTTTLFRPVDPEELALLKASGFKRWPPRLPGQPIFYPVTNEKYAAEIAEKWNVKDSGYGAQLDLYDVDVQEGTLMVHQGKGRKDRLLPIGERACGWIARYVADVRPGLLTRLDERALFLGDDGQPLRRGWLTDRVRTYLEAVGIHKPGACHLFRHTMATLMLENGADLRYIQAMLGHADISTTTIYTHVALAKLREVYERTHPAKLMRTRDAESAFDPA